MMAEIIIYISFLVVVNIALTVDDKRKKRQRKALTIPHNRGKVKK